MTDETMGLGGGGWWIILLFLFAMGNGGFGFGGNNWNSGVVYGDTAATNTDVFQANYQQGVANKLNDIQGAMTQGFFDNAALINNGFNSVNMNLNNLGHQMSQCCCDLKTQMLQDKYDDVRYQLEQANTAVANAVQTQNILGNLGRFVTNPPYYPIYQQQQYPIYPTYTTVG